ncbi:MAG: hypothetical protein WCT04_22915 [Planctomycetota bacterium]
MNKRVVDTNVVLIADGKASHVSGECKDICTLRLESIKRNGHVIIDDGWLILGEYKNKLEPNRDSLPGEKFVKWILQNLANPKFVTQVSITKTGAGGKYFKEFPDDRELETEFDPADRKFIAVANVHPDKPTILQAADSKWLGWEERLYAHGISIEFICCDELKSVRKRKLARSKK